MSDDFYSLKIEFGNDKKTYIRGLKFSETMPRSELRNKVEAYMNKWKEIIVEMIDKEAL